MNTNYCHELMRLVDVGSPKPPDILSEFWVKLQDKRKTKYAQTKNKSMREIATNCSLKRAKLKSIERTVISRLVL
jgi:hypothetical protein